jgi:hypothetical protein
MLRPEAEQTLRGKQEGGEKEVQDPETDIAEPAAQSRKFASSTRPAELAQSDHQQTAEDHR